MKKVITFMLCIGMLLLSVTPVFADEDANEEVAIVYSNWKSLDNADSGSYKTYERTVRIPSGGDYILTYKESRGYDVYCICFIQDGIGTLSTMISDNSPDNIVLSEEKLYRLQTAEEAGLDITVNTNGGLEIIEKNGKGFLYVFKINGGENDGAMNMNFAWSGEVKLTLPTESDSDAFKVDIVGYIPLEKESKDKISLGDYSQEMVSESACEIQQYFHSTEREGLIGFSWNNENGNPRSGVEVIHDWYAKFLYYCFVDNENDIKAGDFQVRAFIGGGIDVDTVVVVE